MQNDFVHLHVHSDYSLLYASSSIEKIVETASNLGQKAIALTDHGNMFGVLFFYRACKAKGIKPIIGCDFYVAPFDRTEKKQYQNSKQYYRLVLLAKDLEGYKNLMILTSKSYIEGLYYKPRIDESLLKEHSNGLVCLSGGISGKLSSLLLEGKTKEAEELSRSYSNIFGYENFFIELQDHGISDEKKVGPLLIKLARRLGIPMVLTNDTHYALKDDATSQDILLCIGTKRTREDSNRLKFYGSDFYIKSADEMSSLFPNYPELITNTVRIAAMCNVDIPKLGPILPIYNIPEGFKNKDEYIDHIVNEGLKQRYETITDEIKKRADYELSVIKEMDFVGYFLIVWDFIKWAKDHDIPVGPGRGSGAGSIVAYAMTITDIDPLKYNLLFERFLNPERVSMPDFDVDFCFERRGEVIDYVREKYSDENVGQIITFGTLKPKAAIKDVGRVLDIPLQEVNAIAKLIPEDPKLKGFKDAFERNEELRAIREEPKYKELFEISEKLENTNRNTSLHAAGIVIGREALVNYVPLYRDTKTGKIATQFPKDLLEDCGLVKMDFLGLKTLTLLKRTEGLIQKKGGEYSSFLIKNIDYTDKATFALLSQGASSAVFQFESAGMQNILKRAKPDKVEDLIALNALYRPGPIDNIDQFIAGKMDPATIKYPDPSLEDILSETYGVIVYQEQVMQVAQRIGGYSLGQADILRRAMSKKKDKEMAEHKVIFVKGALEKGYSKETAERIFDLLIPFSGYGFNKSHAAVYAILAFQTAYLKTHFPAEFMAANLTNEITSVDKLPEYINEAKKLNIEVLPPHVNLSDEYFAVRNGNIVFGFLGIKGIGEMAAINIVQMREKDGEYKSFIEFLDRVDLHIVTKKTLESLINTGCFDGLGETRSTLITNLENAVSFAARKKEGAEVGQVSLFADAGINEFSTFKLERLDEYPKKELLRLEKEFIGSYVSGHPLDIYKDKMEEYATLEVKHLQRATDGKEYLLIGSISNLKSYQAKKGEMCFASLEDLTGNVDLVFFTDTWQTFKGQLQEDGVYGVQGKVSKKERGEAVEWSIIVKNIIDIKDFKEVKKSEKIFLEMHVELAFSDDIKQVELLKNFALEHSGDASFFIHLEKSGTPYIIKASDNLKINGSKNIIDEVLELPIVLNAWGEY